MSIFHREAQMFVAKPKRQLAQYTDLSMPRRDWSKFDSPASERIDARTVCAGQFSQLRKAG